MDDKILPNVKRVKSKLEKYNKLKVKILLKSNIYQL